MITDPATGDLVKLLASHRPGFSLAREFYEDPAVFAADVDRVIARRWHYAGHVSECPVPGSYFLDEIAGESVIVIRGRDQAIRAVHNVCRHRGSRICTEPAGSVKALVCPYHAWNYGLDGRLASAPAMGEDFDPSRYRLKPCAVRVLAGLIFVCLGEPLGDIDQLISDATPFLVPHGLEQARVAKTLRWPTRANWKLVVENFTECYHCRPAHPEFCSVMDIALPATTGNPVLKAKHQAFLREWEERVRQQGFVTGDINRIEDAGYRVHRHPIGRGKLSQSREGRPVAPLLGRYSEYDGGITGLALRPLFSLYVSNDHAVVIRFVPHGPTQTDTVISWLVRSDAEEGRDYDLHQLTWLWRVTTDQDKVIVEDNQAGVSSRAYEPGPYSPLVEPNPPVFHRWYFGHLR
ncbi:MAG: aromatic ring-hydroxylating dioxygenase subunit alpha [Opitutaceae bacterium]|nr:aromatic ring-hydroxylating dioxygenase subunit alpha [Opitutaceae bacterium]